MQPVFDTTGLAPLEIFDKNLQLGTIQEYYSQFLTRYNELLVFVEQKYYPQMNQSLRQQLEMARIQYDRLWEQKNAVDQEYKIKLNHFQRQKSLFGQKAISSVELENAEAEMLNKKSERDGLRSELAQKKIGYERFGAGNYWE